MLSGFRRFEHCQKSDRETFGGIHLDHPPQEVLAVWRNEMGHVKDPELHFLQQVPQVVIVEWQSTLTDRNIVDVRTIALIISERDKIPPILMSTNMYFSMVDT